MKIITASKDGDGYYNYQVQFDEAQPLSPLKTFRYSPFNGIGLEADYITAIEAEIQSTSLSLKAAWIAQGSPLKIIATGPEVFIPQIVKAPIPLGSTGTVF